MMTNVKKDNQERTGNRIFIVDSGRASVPTTLIHELTKHGFNLEMGDISKLEEARKNLVLPNHGVTAYDVLRELEIDLTSMVKYRSRFNKPTTDTPLEFGLYIRLLKDRRSNRHFKMMRRFT